MSRIKREIIKNEKDQVVSRGEYLRQQLEKVRHKKVEVKEYSPHKIFSDIGRNERE